MKKDYNCNSTFISESFTNLFKRDYKGHYKFLYGKKTLRKSNGNNLVKIYALGDPRKPIHFRNFEYIGATNDTFTRYISHIADSYFYTAFKTKKEYWINGLIRENVLPYLFVIDVTDFEKRDNVETAYIKVLSSQIGFEQIKNMKGLPSPNELKSIREFFETDGVVYRMTIREFFNLDKSELLNDVLSMESKILWQILTSKEFAKIVYEKKYDLSHHMTDEENFIFNLVKTRQFLDLTSLMMEKDWMNFSTTGMFIKNNPNILNLITSILKYDEDVKNLRILDDSKYVRHYYFQLEKNKYNLTEQPEII